MFARKSTRIYGRPEDHGLPKPDHKFGRASLTGSSEIFTRIGIGRVTPKPWISRLEGEQVRFMDGSVEHDRRDRLLHRLQDHPALSLRAELLNAKDNSVPLYKRVVHPDRPGLYFIGLIDVAGPLNPLVRAAGAVGGRPARRATVELPSRAQMEQAIAREDGERQKRFGGPGRNALHVDYVPYLNALQRERKRRRRGRRGSLPGPSAQESFASRRRGPLSEMSHARR